MEALDILVSALAPLGAGGVLAAVMFYIYRSDCRENASRWRGTTDILVGVVKENTKVNSELVTLIKERIIRRN